MEELTLSTAQGPSRVVVGRDLLEHLPTLAAETGISRPKAVVSNTTVGPLYGRDIALVFGAEDSYELPDGEEFKTWPQVEDLCRRWVAADIHRSDWVVAVGGGVVTDTVGFAASVHLRGLGWIAVPTSLLAMVDASVGGKTGINLAEGKNLIGTFWQPRLVVVDTRTLETLPEREMRSGFAEIVKSAWIGDQDLLDLINPEAKIDYQRLSEIIVRTLRVKARIVEEDERESGPRKALNLGHTLAHALESLTDYKRFLHGEAVAWGLLAAARLAQGAGVLSAPAAARLEASVAGLGELPPIDDLDPERLVDMLERDKKKDDLGVAWVLPTDEGVLLDQRLERQSILDVIATLPA